MRGVATTSRYSLRGTYDLKLKTFRRLRLIYFTGSVEGEAARTALLECSGGSTLDQWDNPGFQPVTEIVLLDGELKVQSHACRLGALPEPFSTEMGLIVEHFPAIAADLSTGPGSASVESEYLRNWLERVASGEVKIAVE